MGAALSIVILFTVSSTIVRVAGVFLEYTGIPRHIARLQAMSALSGTGFTTAESELILQTPERRKVLASLIVTGSIGLASVVATLVVGAFGVHQTLNGVLLQGSAILAAILFVRYVLLSRKADDLICGIAYAWLARHGTRSSYDILYQIDSETFLAAHRLAASPPQDPRDWPVRGLSVIGIQPEEQPAPMRPWAGEPVPKDAALLLAGPAQAHAAFAEAYGVTRPGWER